MLAINRNGVLELFVMLSEPVVKKTFSAETIAIVIRLEGLL